MMAPPLIEGVVFYLTKYFLGRHTKKYNDKIPQPWPRPITNALYSKGQVFNHRKPRSIYERVAPGRALGTLDHF